MTYLREWPAWLVARWLSLRALAREDRGDSPVSTAVIVAIIAAGAIVVASAVIAAARGWVDIIPKSTGEAPAP